MRREWTPALMIRMAQAAGRRRRHEWVMLAHVIAVGVNAGFTGNFKPLHALAKTLDVSTSSAGARAQGSDMGDVVTRLYARLGSRYG
ncbi:MAG: hypothetical protein GY898_06100 [Proteobacteria bacterium]|nr:hypothetical protein [Pseudomonadota bacterium]